VPQNVHKDTYPRILTSTKAIKRKEDICFWIESYEAYYKKLHGNDSVFVKPNTEVKINDAYWELIDKKVKPVLEKKSPEIKIDRHKIISATEYCIMDHLPLFFTDDGKKSSIENAKLALYISKCILRSWNDGLKDVNLLKFDEEHIVFLANVELKHFPVFSNAATWYLYEQLMIEKSK